MITRQHDHSWMLTKFLVLKLYEEKATEEKDDVREMREGA